MSTAFEQKIRVKKIQLRWQRQVYAQNLNIRKA